MTIKQRQLLLTYLGYYKGKIDGDWGAQSKEATKKFQKAFGITVDGKCGAETQKALKHAVTYGMPENVNDWWEDIEYFDRVEFKCKCGKCGGFPAEPQEKLVRVADRVRNHFNKPITVTSGVRCAEHNKKVGGVANSRHLKGKAMDFSVSGMSASMVLPYVKSLPDVRYAYAIDSNHVHMDIE